MIRYTWTCPDRWQIIRIEVCIDCLYVIANGVESDEHEKAAEAMARLWPASEGWSVVYDCPENCDGGFSWQSCDGCDSHLGGDRHPAVAMRRIH